MGADLYIGGYEFTDKTLFKEDRENMYFRDSYNDSNLLHKYGLSYWSEFFNKREWDTKKITEILLLLEKNKPLFEERMHQLSSTDERYFREKDKQFKKFLNTALKLNLSIEASV